MAKDAESGAGELNAIETRRTFDRGNVERSPLERQPLQEPMLADIGIKDIPNDIPEFKREYTVEIRASDRQCTLKVEIRIWDCGLIKSAELRQHDGRWVYFDPDNIAEKILDRELVPLIQKRVNEIYSIDKAFRKSSPARFIDKSGTRWQRER